MKTKFLILLVATLLLFACSKPDSYDSHNNPIKISDYKGKWVVINYWASWCKPCLTEMPDLSDLYVTSKDKIMVLGVNYDQLSNDEINAFAKKHGVLFPLLQKFPIEKYGINHIEALPITFIIDPNGKLKATLHGPQTRNSILAEM